jgi:hypothetical protein
MGTGIKKNKHGCLRRNLLITWFQVPLQTKRLMRGWYRCSTIKTGGTGGTM